MSVKDLGQNRTGIQMSPVQAGEMEEGAAMYSPPAMADGEAVSRTRIFYAEQGEKLGSVAPPATLKGATKTAIAALKGNHPTTLVDKLSERLAFERAGTRLYEALISKLDAYGSWEGGPTRGELQQIREDELVHFHTVRWAVQKLGGDPTMLSPSADLADVASMGLRKVVQDPRTDLRQSLRACHVAELVDNDEWSLLIALVRPIDEEIAARFEEARLTEVRHLAAVRTWTMAMLEVDAEEVMRAIVPQSTAETAVKSTGGRG